MRRLTLMLVCFLMLAASAQAAQLIPEGSASIAGACAPASAASYTGGATAAYLLDDNPATWWTRMYTPGTSTVDVVLTPAKPTVAAIWMRSGNHYSQQEYLANARPEIVRVDLTYAQGNTLATATYRYAITDAYSPDTASLMWNDGYQCLLLPSAIAHVQSISLTVESTIAGDNNGMLCISDILLADRGPADSNQALTGVPDNEQPAGSKPTTAFKPIETTLLMRLATRSGPSTGYDELGSYFQAGHSIKVLSLCYDNGGVPWVQVEFSYKNRLRRAYTGLKRVDVDETLLPREELLAEAVLRQAFTPRFGPGDVYETRNLHLAAGQVGSIYAYENGWAQFEYFDQGAQLLRRVWVPKDELNIR